ncbi:hypothetical protein BGZ70_002445 [Mortierella alpina]|uniref:Uncharacterized protein n=1 Tax=Mortierella alpina TaxID=64518 RepID=A0A9P6IVS3_MORAP|nr:hypothetical protein BGZ70_002445 [Mortierella alpina]
MSTRLQGMAQDVSTTVTDKTASLVTALRNTSIAQNYILPVLRRARQTYDQSHWTIKVFIASAVAMSAVPVLCFLAFMSVVTVGCLIVAAVAFTIVEGGFSLFGSVFLMPALGVTFLLAGGVGLLFFVLWTCYRMTLTIVGFVWGPGQQRRVEDKTEQWTQAVPGTE